MSDSVSTPGMGAMGVTRAVVGNPPALRRGSGGKKKCKLTRGGKCKAQKKTKKGR